MKYSIVYYPFEDLSDKTLKDFCEKNCCIVVLILKNESGVKVIYENLFDRSSMETRMDRIINVVINFFDIQEEDYKNNLINRLGKYTEIKHIITYILWEQNFPPELINKKMKRKHPYIYSVIRKYKSLFETNAKCILLKDLNYKQLIELLNEKINFI